MVKIKTGVFTLEESRKLITSELLNPEGRTGTVNLEKRFKVVDPYPRNCYENCMFFTCKFMMKHPFIVLFILISTSIIFIGSLTFTGSTLSYAKCIIQTAAANTSSLTNNCYLVDENQPIQKFAPHLDQCRNIKPKDRLNCLGLSQDQIDEEECISRGCCWSKVETGTQFAPHCFYPSTWKSYEFINLTATDMGAVAYLKIIRNSTFPKNTPIIKMSFNYWAEDMLEVKIYDANETRYEPQFPELPPLGPNAAKNTKYVVNVDKEKFGFQIARKSNNQTIFDTQDLGGFIFTDQLIQLTSRLPSNKIFGLGQQRNKFMLDLNWTTITLFNHDQVPRDGSNLYGSHPFYLAMEEGGFSSGVLLLNTNAMDILLSPSPAITYRVIGGVLDFFIFLGPSPAEVLRQYTQLVGRPFLPPYWSLGFHLCRFGYKSLNGTIKVWNRTRAANIPFDTQWNDLDYMENANDFTYDKNTFEGLPDFVDLLHKEGMHYMVLVDPGVSAGELPGAYPPFDQGMAQRIFIMDSSGVMPFKGKVWNKKSTVFVDFFNPAAVTYWMDQLRSQQEMFAFDGAWIDMNDPSNFLDGTTSGCPNSTLDHPPYLPAVTGGKMYFRTVCMSAQHYKGQHHYNLHNVYGLAEAIVTSFAMQQIRSKRAFVISRSSFPGTGRYAGVWTGDITSTWDDMAHSISDILSFSLFGIPMSGADVCGFNGNTTVPLCQRWSQLGAFYPFSRNHNSDQSSDQDPVSLGPAVVEAARSALLVRYSLLPYLYTLFWHAHTHGDTVARPMFVEFPYDNKTYSINSQFLWGPALLIVPVLHEGATNVTAYLPADQWYDFYSYKMIRSNGSDFVLPAPLETIPLLLRGGFVVPSQRPELTTTHSRTNPVDLLVALNQTGQAYGDLYWDDGDSLDHNHGVYNLLNFSVSSRTLCSEVQQWRYDSQLVLGNIRILGVDSVSKVTVEGKKVPFRFDSNIKVLQVEKLFLNLSNSFVMKWK